MRPIWPIAMTATAVTRILYNIVNTRRNAQGTTLTVCYALLWVLMQCGTIHFASIFRVEVSRVCKVEVYMRGVRGNKGYGGQGYPFRASVIHTEDGGSMFYCTLLPAARLQKTYFRTSHCVSSSDEKHRYIIISVSVSNMI